MRYYPTVKEWEIILEIVNHYDLPISRPEFFSVEIRGEYCIYMTAKNVNDELPACRVGWMSANESGWGVLISHNLVGDALRVWKKVLNV